MPNLHEVPESKTPTTNDGYLEELTKAIFRAGFSWQVIRAKWQDFQLAFDGFNVALVANYGLEELERLVNDKSIVRNKQKIVATLTNAQTIQDLILLHGSFWNYLRSMDPFTYNERVKILTREFAGLGRTSAFVFLHSVNEEHPSWQER